MAKRLTDSEKWEDPWFLDLKDEHKLIWIYLLDKCDHAGIWKVNKRLAEFCFGHSLDWEGFLKASNGRIEIISGGEKWFIPKFLNFQYGSLDEKNSMSKRVLPILEKEGLNTLGLPRVNPGKNKYKESNGNKKEKEDQFLEIWAQYPNKAGKTKAFEKFCGSVKTEDDLQAIRQALSRYLKHLQVNTWKQAQDGKTWFNSWRDWENYTEPERSKNAEDRCAELVREIRAF